MSDKQSFEELLNQSGLKDFLFRAERDMFPNMKASAMALVDGSEEPDIKLCLEVGAAILLDKPLLVVLPPGGGISACLQKVATLVVEIDYGAPDAQAKLRAAIERVMPKKVEP